MAPGRCYPEPIDTATGSLMNAIGNHQASSEAGRLPAPRSMAVCSTSPVSPHWRWTTWPRWLIAAVAPPHLGIAAETAGGPTARPRRAPHVQRPAVAQQPARRRLGHPSTIRSSIAESSQIGGVPTALLVGPHARGNYLPRRTRRREFIRAHRICPISDAPLVNTSRRRARARPMGEHRVATA